MRSLTHGDPMPTTPDHDQLQLAYRPKEAARLVGISPATFWRRVAEGKIKTLKKRGVTLVLAAELARWLSVSEP
jgi:hypothetical protein